MPSRVLAALLVATVAGCNQPVQSGKSAGSQNATVPRATKPMSRKAVEELVLGQTLDEVVRRLGTPDRTDQTYRWADGSPDGTVWWFYDGMIQGDAGAKPKQAWLWITGGRVVKVD